MKFVCMCINVHSYCNPRRTKNECLVALCLFVFLQSCGPVEVTNRLWRQMEWCLKSTSATNYMTPGKSSHHLNPLQPNFSLGRMEIFSYTVVTRTARKKPSTGPGTNQLSTGSTSMLTSLPFSHLLPGQ